MGVAEDLFDIAALPIVCLSVGVVVLVLPGPLLSSAQSLDFCAEVLAFLVESCDGAWRWVRPWRRRLDAGSDRVDERGDEFVNVLFTPKL